MPARARSMVRPRELVSSVADIADTSLSIGSRGWRGWRGWLRWLRWLRQLGRLRWLGLTNRTGAERALPDLGEADGFGRELAGHQRAAPVVIESALRDREERRRPGRLAVRRERGRARPLIRSPVLHQKGVELLDPAVGPLAAARRADGAEHGPGHDQRRPGHGRRGQVRHLPLDDVL